MLVNLNDVLLDAKKNKYAVGLFNTVNLEMARGVLGAAEEMKSPVIPRMKNPSPLWLSRS